MMVLALVALLLVDVIPLSPASLFLGHVVVLHGFGDVNSSFGESAHILNFVCLALSVGKKGKGMWPALFLLLARQQLIQDHHVIHGSTGIWL